MTTLRPVSFCLSSTLLLVAAVGCGSNQQTKQDKTFFTSGNRDADQRADQRMAQAQQLSGNTNNGGQTRTPTNAVVATEKKSLYEDLGGSDGINAIVDDFITRALADPRVNWDRIGVIHGGLSTEHYDSVTWNSTPEHVKVLKLHMAQFLALATGGPTQYTGKDMHSSHAHMHITDAEFDASLGDLKQTLDKLQIANQEQKELLSIVESTREQIVEEH